MTGFAADLPGIAAAQSALRAAADDLDVPFAPAGDVGPGRLAAVVGALLAAAESDVARARAAVTALADDVGRARETYTALDSEAASRFDQGPW
ncbi:hypothetical protein [Actinophytocola glycyrrhizae]|uniref:Excreted virulence factor EspC (Type VII ESX diderm) n=1 Tax=Actinophytocola glycyrrhizae TaxID=2044873 RepID=A0ABV9SBM6_9PSEU